MKKELTNATIIVRDVLFVLGKLRGEAIEPELFAFVHHFVKDDKVVVPSSPCVLVLLPSRRITI